MISSPKTTSSKDEELANTSTCNGVSKGFDSSWLENTEYVEETTTIDAPPESGEQASDFIPTSNVEDSESDFSVEALVDVLGTSLGKLSALDPRMGRRVKDFHFAQSERSKTTKVDPYGLLGLFSNLSDIRSDLWWAEDAAWRRENGMPYISWEDFEALRSKGLERPYLTYLLILSHVVMMILAFHENDWKMEPMHINPFAGPSTDSLLELGALNTRDMIENGSWYRLVTATFLHAGVIHLAVNAAALAFLGRAIELNHGIVSTFILYFVPAIGGSVLSGVMQPGHILVGASGGIFGLLGVCLADIVVNWKILFLAFEKRGMSGFWMKIRCIFWLCLELAVNLLIGFTPWVDNYAHLGGMLYGFLVALIIVERLPLSFFGEGNGCCRKLRMVSLRMLAAGLTSCLIAISGIWLGQSDGVSSPCPSCRYISCAPFPFWTDDKWWYCDGCDAASADGYMTEDESFYTDLVLYCPDGTEPFTDIFEYEFSDISDIKKVLPDFCRKLCLN